MQESEIISRAHGTLSIDAFKVWEYFYNCYMQGCKPGSSLHEIADAVGMSPYEPLLNAMNELTFAGYIKVVTLEEGGPFVFDPDGRPSYPH